jgi:hypothetical protein
MDSEEKHDSDPTRTVDLIHDGGSPTANRSPEGEVRNLVSPFGEGSEGKPIALDAVHLEGTSQPDIANPDKARRGRQPTVGGTRSKVVPLPEIHSGMLTDACPRRVQLRIEGKSVLHAPTALYRGVLVGEVLREYHEGQAWGVTPSVVVDTVATRVRKQFDSEGRVMTDSVDANIAEIHAEVSSIVALYVARFADRFKNAELIGCELPCRMQIGKVKFASHLDLLFRDTHGSICGEAGRLVVWDWKWRQDAPTRAYLSRNLQLALYWLMVQRGSICVSPAFDMWNKYEENPVVMWCHLPALKPFSRATTVKDDDGLEREYVKGDFRPERNIIRDCGFRNGMQHFAQDEILKRVELMRRGLDIAIPDPTGCMLCECEPWCRRFDTAETGLRTP